MKIAKTLTTAIVSFSCLVFSFPAKAEWQPQQVVDGMYTGIQGLHGYKATPKLIWGVPNGARGGCGRIYGSHYCKLNHTVYITKQHIRLAYQHGDAALAYIIGHEYAHAMQTAFGFGSNYTAISELQADCLSGVYIGLIPNIEFDNRDVREIASFAYRIGDYNWHDPQHHGTPEQRVKAVVLGMQAASQGKSGISACLRIK
jgi:predicted metalloprotease